MLYYKS